MTSLWTVLWAAPAATGFAMMFNVRKRALPLVAMIAVLARFVSDFGAERGLPLVTADFLAAFLAGAIAYSLAPRTGEAAPVYAFASVIPLVPGAILTHALASLLSWISTDHATQLQSSEEFIAAASSGFTASAILLALCVGAISPMLLLPRSRTPEH